MPRLAGLESSTRIRRSAGGVTLSVQQDFRAIARDFRYLFRKKVGLKKGVTAINRSAGRTTSKAIRETSTDTGIQVSRIRWVYSNTGRRTKRRRFRVSRARFNRPFVTIVGSPLDPTIASLGPVREDRRPGGGVIQRGRFFRGAFVQAPRGTDIALKRVGSSRYPIEQVRRNFKPQADTNMFIAIGGVGKKTFVTEFEKLMRLELRRVRRRR